MVTDSPVRALTWEDMGFRKWVRDQLIAHQGHVADASRPPADFSNRDLRGWDFSALGDGLPLKGVRAIGACMADAKLPRADLRGAKLALSDLEGADLTDADLSHADLRGARLDGANLKGARMDGVNLGPADLKTDRRTASRQFDKGKHIAGMAGADLSGARLRKATMTGCDLTGSVFRGADLSGADMSYAIVVDCEFEDADGAEVALAALNAANDGPRSTGDALADHARYLNGDPSGACLSWKGRTASKEVFAGRDLSQARFIDCVFQNCDFSETILDQADFAGSTFIQCSFVAVSAAGVSFRRTRMEKCEFARAQIGVLSMGEGGAGTTTKLLSSFERATFVGCNFGGEGASAILRQPEFRNACADAVSLAELKTIGIPVPVLRRFTVVQGD